jgi:hypothetical protein
MYNKIADPGYQTRKTGTKKPLLKSFMKSCHAWKTGMWEEKNYSHPSAVKPQEG